MATSKSFQKKLNVLRLEIKTTEQGITGSNERRALSRFLANQLGAVAGHTRDKSKKGQLTETEGSGVWNLTQAAETALKGRPAPKAILHNILRAMNVLKVLP